MALYFVTFVPSPSRYRRARVSVNVFSSARIMLPGYSVPVVDSVLRQLQPNLISCDEAPHVWKVLASRLTLFCGLRFVLWRVEPYELAVTRLRPAFMSSPPF